MLNFLLQNRFKIEILGIMTIGLLITAAITYANTSKSMNQFIDSRIKLIENNANRAREHLGELAKFPPGAEPTVHSGEDVLPLNSTTYYLKNKKVLSQYRTYEQDGSSFDIWLSQGQQKLNNGAKKKIMLAALKVKNVVWRQKGGWKHHEDTDHLRVTYIKQNGSAQNLLITFDQEKEGSYIGTAFEVGKDWHAPAYGSYLYEYKNINARAYEIDDDGYVLLIIRFLNYSREMDVDIVPIFEWVDYAGNDQNNLDEKPIVVASGELDEENVKLKYYSSTGTEELADLALKIFKENDLDQLVDQIKIEIGDISEDYDFTENMPVNNQRGANIMTQIYSRILLLNDEHKQPVFERSKEIRLMPQDVSGTIELEVSRERIVNEWLSKYRFSVLSLYGILVFVLVLFCARVAILFWRIGNVIRSLNGSINKREYLIDSREMGKKHEIGQLATTIQHVLTIQGEAIKEAEAANIEAQRSKRDLELANVQLAESNDKLHVLNKRLETTNNVLLNENIYRKSSAEALRHEISNYITRITANNVPDQVEQAAMGIGDLTIAFTEASSHKDAIYRALNTGNKRVREINNFINIALEDYEGDFGPFNFEPCGESLFCTFTERGLDMAIRNVLSNAYDFRKEKTSTNVSVTQIMRSGLSQKKWVRIKITNSGPPLPNASPNGTKCLFEFFSSSRKRKNNDDFHMGLGLAVVHEVMTAHGGKARAINNRSAEEVSICLYLPLTEQGSDLSLCLDQDSGEANSLEIEEVH